MKVNPRRYIGLLICLPIFTIISACGEVKEHKNRGLTESKDAARPVEKTGQLSRFYCDDNPNFSYSIYIPKTFDSSISHPLFLFFDPQGDGSMPLLKYQSLADRNQWFFAGSNNSKNGLSPEETGKIVTSFLTDITRKSNFKISGIYACGFSGGARVALQLALSNSAIKGVFMNSAGFIGSEKLLIKPLSFALSAVGGLEDFNLLEIFNSFDHLFLVPKHISASFKVFNGKHDWAPAESVEQGLDFLLNADTKLYMQSAQLDFNSFKNAEEKYFKQELLYQNKYRVAITSEGKGWWQKEINQLNDLRNKTPSTHIKDMIARVEGYMSILAYSYSKQALEMQQSEIANLFVDIYILVDPFNPDCSIFKARSCMLDKRKDEALTYIEKSINLGFKNKESLLAEPDFQEIKTEPRFIEAISKIKSGQHEN
jgi:hypothetical protein